MKTFQGGVHAKDNKLLASASEAFVMPSVGDYYVSLSQHIGAPASAIVNAGDVVKEGQLIAKAEGAVSANVYSPVCGEVVGVEKRVNAIGQQVDCLHIKANGENDVITLSALKNPSATQIAERIAEAGIVGMGGAGFPTAVKLAGEGIDTLIINGAECEPYLTCDDYLMRSYAYQIAEGAKLLATAVGASKIYVAIEDNKPEAISAMSEQEGIEVVALPTKYPQGAEKMVIYSCTGKKVPLGKLPASVGVLVNNVATAYAVYQAVVRGKPLYERVVTVTGSAVAQPQNVVVKCGTTLADLIAFCGGLTGEEAKVVAGGPMTGNALISLDVSVGKTDGGYVALTAKEVNTLKPTACINCGKCAQACPMQLEPMYIDFYANAGEWETADKYGASSCISCGACAYVCPAKRDIISSVRLTKSKLKEK